MRHLALIPGHTKRSPGAGNEKLGIVEFDFNDQLITEICHLMPPDKMRVSKFYREERLGYSSAMRNLGRILEKEKVDLALEFHLNAAEDKTANGHEVLHHFQADRTTRIAARSVALALGRVFLNKTRGDNGCSAIGPGERGFQFLDSPVRCLIIEPVFISNDAEAELLIAKRDQYILAMAAILEKIISEVVL